MSIHVIIIFSSIITASELVLVGHGRSSQPLTLTLRATTLEQKCVWKNLVEQRVGVCKSQSDAMSCYMSDTFI